MSTLRQQSPPRHMQAGRRSNPRPPPRTVHSQGVSIARASLRCDWQVQARDPAESELAYVYDPHLRTTPFQASPEKVPPSLDLKPPRQQRDRLRLDLLIRTTRGSRRQIPWCRPGGPRSRRGADPAGWNRPCSLLITSRRHRREASETEVRSSPDQLP